MASTKAPTMFEFIDFGVRAGLSMRAMLRLYRDAGNSVRTETFAEQYAKHLSAIERMRNGEQ